MDLTEDLTDTASPVILVLVFITFFHTVLSRHKIRHYGARFKRQNGAHLYLPDSYVTEGGSDPDRGPWSEWSAPSPCSRSCGGGVSSQYRQCQEGYSCQGPDRRYFSCNTQDCPDTGDYRSQQCSEFDDVPFDGITYQWVPYTKGPEPCELNCMPRGERFYYRHREQVIDGTKCNDNSQDVCVNGKCQPVGCDMMLGSSLREDECRVCGGNGSTCETKSGSLELRDMITGYNDILLIPAGATNIIVEEEGVSNNYLAIRNTSGHYYINGNWRLDLPQIFNFAGTKFNYERDYQGFDATDKIFALGPIEEPLFVVMLYQGAMVPIRFRYSLPNNIVSGSESETYAWTFDEFTPCSSSCGGGIQYRNVSCAGRKTLDPVDEGLCDAARKPETSRRCGEVPCEAEWVPHPWGKCSAPCGSEGGVQSRDISCQQLISNGYSALVEDSLCKGPKPATSQRCNEGKTCATWHTGPWKPCDHLCGEGKQTRKVQCFIKDENNKIKTLTDAECESVGEKPEEERKCFVRPCEGVDWITSEWSGCDSVCGLTNETRKVFCSSKSGQIYAEDTCDLSEKPEDTRPCKSTNVSCVFLWYASQWSECSSRCGKGIQTRTVFCGLESEDGIKKVENDKCDKSKQDFETLKNCTGEEECKGEWYSGPWTECSKPCGSGTKHRKVLCIQADEVVDVANCDSESILFAEEECNKDPCSADSILPTDVTKSIDESEKPEKPKEKSKPAVTTEAAVTEAIEKATTEVTEKESTDLSTSESEAATIKADETTTEGDSTAGPPSEETTEGEVTEKEGSTITDLTLITEGFELTSEKEKEPSEKVSEDDYEYVESDDCEDGDWVDVEGGDGVLKEEPFELEEETTTAVAQTTPAGDETSFSLDDLMMSDGTTVGDESSPFTGSGEGESTKTTVGLSEETETEGSGSEPSTIVTDDEGSSVITITMTSETPVSGSTEESAGTEETSTLLSTDGSDGTETTESGSTVSGSTDDTTESGTTETQTTETSESTSETSESSSSSESTSEFTTDSTTEFGTESTTESGSESTTEGGSESTTVSGETTTEGETVTTVLGETSTLGGTESTTSSVTEESGSTESTSEGSTISTQESSTELTESTTEGSTESTGPTESTSEYSTESTSEFTTESDIFSSTVTEESTTSWGTTPLLDLMDLFKTAPRMCKRRKIMQCKQTKWGCCWDKITPAKGPFDEGCPTPHTCKESQYGCCLDGVSAALGPKNRGCPRVPCNETLFGCCPDKKTPAEGNNNEGCPPPPPKCLRAKFGCCPDKKTPAKGPKNKGCEKKTVTKKPSKEEPEIVSTTPTEDCNESTYGCCPDGSIAEGPGLRGCDIPCAKTAFGCCADKQTPAHGPDGLGCCLSGPFGCCPDDITFARGPNKEGCECQNSPYGCCPDNSTAAQGPEQKGCGCRYSVNGCCPDDFTEASGPGYEGCHCHTYQFGCCPDGVKPAEGPNQQGCDCRSSEFGCCSDEKTPAPGPEKAGCTCEMSKYGCCLDGVSEAQGDNFDGCSEVPVDRQAACGLEKDRGPCSNYSVKWFFDTSYAGCNRFWYGGCEGNDNRFKSEEECEEVCVRPEGTDRCNLPKSTGTCTGYEPKWYYDRYTRQCTQFIYTGCLGNDNRFDSYEDCMNLCSKDERAVDSCEQDKDEGPCRGQFRRFFFDKTSGDCLEFVYGGCKGNGNNFFTKEACQHKCAAPGSKRDHCTLPKAEGACAGKEARWYYGSTENRCLPFYYTGCEGNKNNFESRDACEIDCPTEVAKDTCHLPAETGECGNYVAKWYFDTQEKKCRPFYWGGCGGNNNNFDSQQQCEQHCAAPAPTEPIRPPTRGPNIFERFDQPSTTSSPMVPTGFQPRPPPTIEEICAASPDPGPCDNYTLSFYYDVADGVCKNFTYGGCGGNYNNFPSAERCQQYCGYSQDVCFLPPIIGNCEDQVGQYYYDSSSDSCLPFTYSGCDGNYNRFEDVDACEQRCKGRSGRPEARPTQPPVYYPQETTLLPAHECQAVFDRCATIHCPYGVNPFIDENGCNGCRCLEDPCLSVQCPEGNRCALDVNLQRKYSTDPEYVAACREVNKPGQCPAYVDLPEPCERKCGDDADCQLDQKCCNTGCGTVCAKPAVMHTAKPVSPPRIDVEIFRPEAFGALGDQAVLNCAVSGNPNPKITWSKENFIIDGTHPRYRVRLDQTLQIITLHRTDAGIYLCTANNSVGPPIQNSIKLEVLDDVEPKGATILNAEDRELETNVITSINAPAFLPCYALGYPFPAVTWWKNDEMIPLKNREYEVRGGDYTLLIHSVQLHNLGVYTCQAYNGIGKAASWSITMRAQGPYNITNPADVQYLEYVINPDEPKTTTQAPYRPPFSRPTPEPYHNPPQYTEPNPEIVPVEPDTNEIVPELPPQYEPGPNYIVPVTANITTNEQHYPTGSEIQILCEVHGYPIPQVSWYKDGVPLLDSEKISISLDTNTLTIRNGEKSDSGNYQCEATNSYSKASSSLEISIEGMYIHPSCKDSPFLAKCELIVKHNLCNHLYYSRFCCRSCTEAGLLPVDGPHLWSQTSRPENSFDNNII